MAYTSVRRKRVQSKKRRKRGRTKFFLIFSEKRQCLLRSPSLSSFLRCELVISLALRYLFLCSHTVSESAGAPRTDAMIPCRDCSNGRPSASVISPSHRPRLVVQEHASRREHRRRCCVIASTSSVSSKYGRMFVATIRSNGGPVESLGHDVERLRVERACRGLRGRAPSFAGVRPCACRRCRVALPIASPELREVVAIFAARS